MAIPEVPRGIRKTLELPLAWAPLERMRATSDYWMQNARSWPNANDGQALYDYLDLVKNQYIITGDAVAAAERAVTWHSTEWPLLAPLFLDDPDTPSAEVIAAFEQHALGVTPGEAWQEHPAGFGGGNYPIEAVAALAGLTPDQYREYVAGTGPHPGEHVLIRSANYLAGVSTRGPETSETVLIGEVTRLSTVGIAVLESTLSAYAAGKNEALR